MHFHNPRAIVAIDYFPFMASKKTAIPQFYSQISTPIGTMFLILDEERKILRSYKIESEKQFLSFAKRTFGAILHKLPSPLSSIQYNLDDLTDFSRSVLYETENIPAGQTRTYEQIAVKIGHPKAQRAVGSALARNPVPYLIPCHRVIRKDGNIGNYILGKEIKEKLLQEEVTN